jgi:hypothetical protein
MAKIALKPSLLAVGSFALLRRLAHAQSTAELAKQALNPVAAMHRLPVQYNWDQKIGPTGDGMRSVSNIQPVLPFELVEGGNLISRTILPVIDQRSLMPNDQADKSGGGDLTQSVFFSPKAETHSGWMWGLGRYFSCQQAAMIF